MSDFNFITPTDEVYNDITPGTVVASKAVITDASNKIDTLDITALKIGGTAITASATELNLIDTSVAGTAVASKALVLGADKNVDVLAVADLKLGTGAGTSVTATATEINNLDALTRGSIIVGGVDNTTGKLDAKSSGQILVGDGTDLVSVVVGGDATLASDGTLALAVPKLSYINKICNVADFTDDGGTSGHIDFSTQLPAGAIVLGWKAVVGAGFAGDTSAVIQIGVDGTLGKFSASVAQSVFAAGTVGSGAPMDTCFNATASTPRVTVTGNADFSSIVTEGNGAMNVYLYYIVTV